MKDLRRFLEASLERQAVAGDEHCLGVAGRAFQRLLREGQRLTELVLAEQGGRKVGHERGAVRYQRQGCAQALFGADMVARIGVRQRLEEEAFGTLCVAGRGGGNGRLPAMTVMDGPLAKGRGSACLPIAK
jgi:hypothetical protein